MRRTLLLLSLCLMLLSAAPAATLDTPIFAEPYLRSGEKLNGNVTAWDRDGFTIHTSDDRNVKWDDVTPSSAFVLRSRLIDKHNANDWLDLGEMGWKSGLKEQARYAFTNATRIDPTLKSRVGEITSAAPGGNAPGGNAPGGATTRSASFANRHPTSAPVKYIKSTPEQDAAAISHAKKMADEVAGSLKIKFTELQTSHFIVFTDWDPREFDFLKKNVEGAYSVVSRQFDIPDSDNVFVGKLPVFMFSKQDDFLKYAADYDEMQPNKLLLGYYASHGDGTGHMTMWKPAAKALGMQGQNMEVQWAYTLTHEFTHAFVDRYKSSRQIPRWLNEGLAEVIAQQQFPRSSTRSIAREIASSGAKIDFLFDDDHMPSGEYYPVMQTMVQMLIDTNRKNFLTYFDAIKDGSPAEDALTKYFNLNNKTLPEAWRHYVER